MGLDDPQPAKKKYKCSGPLEDDQRIGGQGFLKGRILRSVIYRGPNQSVVESNEGGHPADFTPIFKWRCSYSNVRSKLMLLWQVLQFHLLEPADPGKNNVAEIKAGEIRFVASSSRLPTDSTKGWQ